MAPRMKQPLTLESIEQKLDSGRLNRAEMLSYLQELPKSPDVLDNSDRVFRVMVKASYNVLEIGDFTQLSKICVEAALGVCALSRQREQRISSDAQMIAGEWIVKADAFGDMGKASEALMNFKLPTMPSGT